MAVRWTFHDPFLDESASFLINPKEGGSPQYERHLTYQHTTAEDGTVLVFEGADQPLAISFSGSIYDEAEYVMLVHWFRKRNAVVLTDDLGRSFTVAIKTFSPKRVRSGRHFWKHSYDVTLTVMSTVSG